MTSNSWGVPNNIHEQNNSRQMSILLSKYAICDGKTDDRNSFSRALKTAKDNKAQLIVDCPIYLKIGMDINKPIFIDSDISISFNRNGLIKVDNIFVPAFVIANSLNINLSAWNIEYIGQMPISNQTYGYYNNHKWIQATGSAPPANAFNNLTLTNWLQTNRGIKFTHGYFSFWTGILDPAAIFYIQGDSSHIVIQDFNIFVESSVTVDRFIPIAFALVPGYTNNLEVKKDQPFAKPYLSTPHKIQFDNIRLDGFYMGWHGSLQDATFNKISAYRYSTLQESNGQNIGGLNKWFPPPHLFYLNYQNNWESSLYNDKLRLTNIHDYGIRIGNAEDTRHDTHVAGNACSLKIQANNSIVNNYLSNRPDGFLDMCSSANLTLSNIIATYDSQFLDYLFPIIRFPCIKEPYTGYQNILFENVTLNDKAQFTFQAPITGNSDKHNHAIRLNNVNISLNTWIGDNEPFNPLESSSATYFSGTKNVFDVTVQYNNSYNTVTNSRVSINKLESTNYNNTLQNIPVGSLGIRSYIITNVTNSIVEINLPSKSTLPDNIGYNTLNTSCQLPITRLKPNQSCSLSLKYQPIRQGFKGMINFKVLVNNPKSKTDELPILTIPYSSRK